MIKNTDEGGCAMGRMVGFVCGLVFLGLFAGCSTGSGGSQSEVSLEDWKQPGWMIELLAEREEYAVRLKACYDGKGAKDSRIVNGSASIYRKSSGDLELDAAQDEINERAIAECQQEDPLPEYPTDKGDVEYGRYVDLYECLIVHDVNLPAMLSKETWIEAFGGGNRASGDFGKPELYDPYTIINNEDRNHEYYTDPAEVVTLQGICVTPNWSKNTHYFE